MGRRIPHEEGTPMQARSRTSTRRNGSASGKKRVARVLDARPDTLDFRDRMYVPTLVEVPPLRPLAAYQAARVPILDQGSEGACTGFGLATVVHYLLRTRGIEPDALAVSPYMLYDMARRYDEWPGEAYEGSSCRGAMKGWHKHGVCTRDLWPASGDGALSEPRVNDGARRPLGAYFRVNHLDLVAMHAAISEVGVLYVSANVHAGWDDVGKDGHIGFREGNTGGHAFALVAYDRTGFWLQNSWGPKWGHKGFAHLSYHDWLANGSDAWVARMAVPIELPSRVSTSAHVFAGVVQAKSYSYNEVRPHVISTGNDGLLNAHGNIGTTAALVKEIVHEDIPRITAGWKRRRIVLYAHGGLVNEDGALQRVSDYRKAMLDAQCYPLAFVWHSDAWSTLKNILSDAADHRRPEGVLDASKDFMLDRLDDALEPLARILGGKLMWTEMKENAVGATADPNGGARLVLQELARADYPFELHLVGHSAGSIFLAPLVQLWTTAGIIAGGPLAGQQGFGRQVESATLWAPAITVDAFAATWLAAMPVIARFALLTLADDVERDDDCANIYHKSLLYLVSNAFEERFRVPLLRPDGEPLLGLAKFVAADPRLAALFAPGTNAEWIVTPNAQPEGSRDASRARHHGDFDDDKPTVLATLERVLGRAAPVTRGAGARKARALSADMQFVSSAQQKRAIRRRIDLMRDDTLTR